MSRRIVAALGGNALGKNLAGQMHEVKITARSLAGLIVSGEQVVITHGNGPQVGMIHNAFGAYKATEPEADTMPLSMCVAMSQGYIGYDIQNALREELISRGVSGISVATILTQVVVDKNDPAFLAPSKPIGPFYTQAEAASQTARTGASFREDSGRGWRQVVASPEPLEIVEIGCIRALVEDGHVVIAGGGGGIPVARDGNSLHGVPAVIDKDLASARLADQLDADTLLMLTAVDAVALDFGKPSQRDIAGATAGQMLEYAAQGQFAPGSMLPKVQAAVRFVQGAPGRRAIIARLENASEALAGRTGTLITG